MLLRSSMGRRKLPGFSSLSRCGCPCFSLVAGRRGDLLVSEKMIELRAPQVPMAHVVFGRAAEFERWCDTVEDWTGNHQCPFRVFRIHFLAIKQ